MIQTDSRLVKSGDVFIAIPCANVINHIQQALQLGASVVFTEETSILNEKVVIVKDAFMLASRLARVSYPLQPKVAIAITGTNGKSSVAHFFTQILHLNNINVANLGTLGLFINNNKENLANIPGLTTPDAMNLHRILDYLHTKSIDYLSFEASSAALDQKRLHSVTLTAAAFTNLASDHLDYHKTHEAYFDAKLRLFSEILPQTQPAIVSKDDSALYQQVKSIHPYIISFGYRPENSIYAYDIEASVNKIKFKLSIDGIIINNLELNLFGMFQLTNVLVAIALVYSSNILDTTAIAKVIPYLTALDGRMDRVTVYNGAHIFVDYAHTSGGFKNALQEFRKYTSNRLICVFGCGGNRDASKREEMGKIANDFADIVIVTDDNPRLENPKSIRQAILKKCPKGVEIADRKEAITFAIKHAQPGDIIAIIGKGHECVQIYGNKEYQFNDKAIVTEIINSLKF